MWRIRTDFASQTSCELPQFSLVDLICFPRRVETKKVRVSKRLGFSVLLASPVDLCSSSVYVGLEECGTFLRDSERGS